MATSTPPMYKDKYLGVMSPEQADLILQLRESTEIPALKHMLFNFPYEMVLRSLEEKRSIRSMIAESGEDYTKYIGELRPYQTIGAAFMYMSPRSILGDGVGLGKTAEISALINYLHQTKQMTRFIMAVENSALGQTQAELIKFTGLYVIQLPSEGAKLNRMLKKIDWSTVDGIVIKHSALRSDPLSKWIAINLRPDGSCKIFDTFILDESSVIKNVATKTYSYTKNMCDLARRVHFLNATTFETHIMDIYNQMDMMYEALLPKKWRIEKEYCTFGRSSYWTKENGQAKMNWRRDLTGYKNQERFKQSLGLVYFGRCKKDVGLEVPHVYKVYEVEPTTEQSLALSKKYRYNEILNCPSLIPEVNIPTDRKSVPKLDRLCELVEKEFSGLSIMVYCFHLEAQQRILDELKKIGRNPVILNGACKDVERFQIQNDFNNGKYDVIITNIKKSLNLYGGDVCIFYSVDTNPSKMEQIHGRIDRNVDKSIKTFVLLLYKGTDEYRFFTDVVKQRAKDARDLTIDAKTTVDHFIDAMIENEEADLGT